MRMIWKSWIWILAGLSPGAAAESGKDVDGYVLGLASSRFEEREAAAAGIRNALASIDKEGDLPALQRIVESLRARAQSARDLEVGGRLTDLLAPYQGGALLASQEGPRFPGDKSLRVDASRILSWWFHRPCYFVSCRDAESGKTLWENRVAGLMSINDLWVADRRVFAVGVHEGGRCWLGAFSLDKGKLLWQRKPEESPEGQAESAQFKQGRIVLGGGDSRGVGWMLSCDAGTGNTVWEKKGNEIPGKVCRLFRRGNLIFAQGVVARRCGWIGSYDIDTGAAAWQKERELPGFANGFRVLPESLLAGGRREGAGWMGCYEPGSGKTAWEWRPGETPGQVDGFETDGTQVVAWGPDRESRHWVWSCNARTGKLLWKETLPGEARAAELDEGRLTITLKDRIGCRDMKTGKPVGREEWAPSPGTIDCIQGGEKRMLVWGKGDPSVPGWLGEWDLENGKMLWSVSLSGMPRGGKGETAAPGWGEVIYDVRATKSAVWVVGGRFKTEGCVMNEEGCISRYRRSFPGNEGAR